MYRATSFLPLSLSVRMVGDRRTTDMFIVVIHYEYRLLGIGGNLHRFTRLPRTVGYYTRNKSLFIIHGVYICV